MPSYSTIPVEVVTRLVTEFPVVRADLDAIRDPLRPSRFQGVYRHQHGGINRGNSRYTIHYYRARVLKFFELGSGFASAEDAARAVCAFYKSAFGERWRIAFRRRKVIPWRLRRVYRESVLVGYAAEIYVRGTPVGVTDADVSGRGPGATERWTWPSPHEAKQAARTAMARWFKKEVSSLPVAHPGLLFWRG